MAHLGLATAVFSFVLMGCSGDAVEVGEGDAAVDSGSSDPLVDEAGHDETGSTPDVSSDAVAIDAEADETSGPQEALLSAPLGQLPELLSEIALHGATGPEPRG